MTEANETKAETKLSGLKTGFVAKQSGGKTLSVVLEDVVKHPVYGKYIKRQKKLAVDDPQEMAHVGDLVEIVPCRPVSKRKSWRVVRVVRASQAETAK